MQKFIILFLAAAFTIGCNNEEKRAEKEKKERTKDPRVMDIFIMDKTVWITGAQEHRSLHLVLEDENMVKGDSLKYDINKDYWGFFPKENDEYDIKDLQGKSEQEIDSLSRIYDMAYYTDTYGMYYNEWYRDTLYLERSEKIYGGLVPEDLTFLKKMKDQGKLVMTEFVFMHSPTPDSLRRKAEELFDIKWTGWKGRYFRSLDTSVIADELPIWVVRLYKQQHNGEWPFTKAGLVIHHESETIDVLEVGTHLYEEQQVPIIYSKAATVDTFGVPDSLAYPFWFDITTTNSGNVLATYEVNATKKGDSIFRHHGLPTEFPAVIEQWGQNKFYYFAGDFSDNPVPNNKDFNTPQKQKYFDDRKYFYSDFYRPMVSKIINRYYNEVVNTKRDTLRRTAVR